MSEFLKCDADGCDHLEHMVEITADMVGKPCPKCGANLLTQHDFDVYLAVFRPAMQAMIDEGLVLPGGPDTPRENLIKVNYHEGQLTVTSPFRPGSGEAA